MPKVDSMATQLTYYLQRGSITGTAAGQRLSADTQPPGDLGSWTRMQGLDVRWEVVDYGSSTSLGPGTGRGSGAPTLATCKHYTGRKNLIFVDDGGPGLLIHGWPPCGGSRCVAVKRGWETLFSTLARERRGSIHIL
jgi:hypothetical protein